MLYLGGLMKRAFIFLLLALVCITVFAVAVPAVAKTFSFENAKKLFSSIFFIESTTTEALRGSYLSGERIRVLIVPGHDDEAWGTEFRRVRESDMTALLGEELTLLLSSDAHYEPILVRNRNGYAKEFEDYFKSATASVKAFVANKKQIMKDLMKRGMLEREDGVIHNNAPSDIAYRLYAINKWANEHGVDMVVHIHFNDYPGRRASKAGVYNGFSIYVPDAQYSNAKPSGVLGDMLAKKLAVFLAPSNLPGESGRAGVVSDQTLIALGSYNTLDPASVLVEYGYIYEPRFLDMAVRNIELRELAFQTYLGLNRFFGNITETFRKYPTTLLPHRFDEVLSQSSGASPDILSLQTALALSGAYPPAGEDLHSCPRSGSYGSCTSRAVKEFQKEQGIAETGALDEATRGKVNELYGR